MTRTMNARAANKILTTNSGGRVVATRKPKAKPMRETQIVLGALEYLRWSAVLAWRQNTGGMTDRRGQFVRFGVPGTADIIGIVRSGPHRGRFVAIECKRPGESRTERQEAWSALVLDAGAISLLVHSVDELVAMLAAELAKPAGGAR